MTDAPKRIWADPPETFDGMDVWRSEPGGKGVEYILASEHAALIREAEARGMERAETHIAAIERLAISASIASCTCLTKTPDITFHAADCRYVYLQYIIAQCEDFRAAKGDPT